MSKILFVCSRNKDYLENIERRIDLLSNRLEPDNISFNLVKLLLADKLISAIFNPNDSVLIHGTSICSGKMINPSASWWKPSTEIPDGSYVLYRSSEERVEVITDIVASKSVWFYFDEEVFIASSSQRAIVFLLESFVFNPQVIPWMLATGGLGPDLSWDKRLKLMQGDSSLILDRNSWKIVTTTGDCHIKIKKASISYHEKNLLNAVEESIGSIDLDYTKWVLPLSGGYDSRGILYMLKTTSGLQCITWGVENSQNEKGNDAYVAKKLARKLEVDHNYLLTDISNEPIADIFRRFLICGEGRIDNVLAYMDGMKIWKDLYESGIHGVIRGDEGFGHFYVHSDLDVRMKVGASYLSDYSNLQNIHDYGILKQDVPGWLLKKVDETNETWRDRLYHQYRLPHIISALNEIKLPFVEVITPLLTKVILKAVRELPDDLRSEKRLFRKIVDSTGPRLPYAIYDAVKTPSDILGRKDVVNEITTEFNSGNTDAVLPQEFIKYLLINMSIRKDNILREKFSFYRTIKTFMPEKLKRLLRNTVLKKEMDFNLLAFRSYIISKMNTMLSEDSKALK